MLVACNECKEQISSAANACPKCGAPRTPIDPNAPSRPCPSCKGAVPMAMANCPACGVVAPINQTPALVMVLLMVVAMIYGIYWFSFERSKVGVGNTPAQPIAAPTSTFKMEGTLSSRGMCGFEVDGDYQASLGGADSYVTMCKTRGQMIPAGTRASRATSNWTGGCKFLILEGALMGRQLWGPCEWLK